MRLGELIKKYRYDHDMSMDSFAKASGLSKAYISMLENNKNPNTGMGISQKTIEARGGWSPGSPILRRTYQNMIEEEARRETIRINEHFQQFA